MHSETRMVIEHTFGELKARWRELLHQVHAKPDNAADVIFTCCVLHNVCRFYDDKYWPSWDVSDATLAQLNRVQPVVERDGFYATRDRNLLNWRNRLCENLAQRRFDRDVNIE